MNTEEFDIYIIIFLTFFYILSIYLFFFGYNPFAELFDEDYDEDYEIYFENKTT